MSEAVKDYEKEKSSVSSGKANKEEDENYAENTVTKAATTLKPQAQSSSSSLSSSHSKNSSHSASISQPGPSSSTSSSSRSFSKIYRKEKFFPNKELVEQIMDMGICRNGAIKALYWTGNHSALTASNWIFDQPDRDLDTPLEDELEMIRQQQAERDREEEVGERLCHHHHHMMHQHELEDSSDYDEDLMMEEEEEEEEDDDEEEFEDEDEYEEMEYKMVFVINKSLDMKPGAVSLHVARATAGMMRKVNAQPQSAMIGPDELTSWDELGQRMYILAGDNDQHMKGCLCQVIKLFELFHSRSGVDG